MSSPKRHHYIPKTLLKGFTDNNGKLWSYRKGSSNSRVYYTTPENVFVEKDFYTQYDYYGHKDYSAEKKLAMQERKATPVIAKMIKAARSGESLLALTKAEKIVWNDYFCLQWVRIPYMFKKFGDSIFEDAVAKIEKAHGAFSTEERIILNQKKPQIIRTIWAQSTNIYRGEAIEALENMGLIIGVIKNPRKSFIIGSRPVMKITPNGHNRFDDPHVEALLPIAHDVIVTPNKNYTSTRNMDKAYE